MINAVGFIFIYDENKDKRLLIAKPEETSWTGTFSIPYFEGNNLSDAIKGIYDQYKIVIRSNEVPRRSSPFHYSFINEHDELIELDYWIIRIRELKELRLNTFIIPKSRMENIGWAGLVPWNMVHGRILQGLRTLYKYLELLTKNDWKLYNRFYGK